MKPRHLEIEDLFISAVNDAAREGKPVSVIETLFIQFCQVVNDKERERLDMLRFMLKDEFPFYRVQYAALDLLVADPDFAHVPPNYLARLVGRCGGWMESREYIQSNHRENLTRWGNRSGDEKFSDEQRAVTEVCAIYKRALRRGQDVYPWATGKPDVIDISEDQMERLAVELYRLFKNDLTEKDGQP